MDLRIGKVTQVYPDSGKVQVTFEDTNSASLPLPMLTMNNEYSMPDIGSRVVTAHFDSGTSKGVVLGTYYYDGNTPNAASGYRKDFTAKSYMSAGKDILFHTSSNEITIDYIVTKLIELEREIKTLAERACALEEENGIQDSKIKELEEQINKAGDAADKIDALTKRVEALEKKGGT